MTWAVVRVSQHVALLAVVWFASFSAFAGDRLEGRVEGGGSVISNATVTLWGAGPSGPKKLGETKTGVDGNFDIEATVGAESAQVLYLIAKGPNPSVSLMTTLGTELPERVAINELTTVASAWTATQFLDGDAMKGNPLGLRIASGNVPNLVDLETGGLGTVIQDALNGSQTTTLAKFNTLGNLLSACITAMPDACDKLFAAATPPGGGIPGDTLAAAQNIARYPGHHAQKLFELFEEFYPVPAGKRWRDVPNIPYLNFAPSAWTLSLVYAGGGLNSLGGIAIDSEGNMWADDNFLAGSQSTIYAGFGGGLSKLAPNGKPLSPMTTGFRGGGIDGLGSLTNIGERIRNFCVTPQSRHAQPEDDVCWVPRADIHSWMKM